MEEKEPKSTGEPTAPAQSARSEEETRLPPDAAFPANDETPIGDEAAGGDEIDYEALAAEDIRELQKDFPELSGKESVAELDSPLRYAQLRDLGLSPKEAYLAIGGGRNAGQEPNFAHYDNRSHLRPSVPRTAARTEEGLSASEMESARDLFSGVSDAEIRRLYRRVTAGK